jgi:MFS family permease
VSGGRQRRQASGAFLVALLCLAEVLNMLGNATFPALIPVFQREWGLSNTGAGWVSGVYYAGYVAAVPLLVSLTDRRDARLIYVLSSGLGALGALGFALFAVDAFSAALWRVLGGVGLAGTYMVGLKILADRVEGPNQSRAVAFYTAHFNVGVTVSVLAAGEIAALADWSWAFGLAALGNLAAALLILVFVADSRTPAGPAESGSVLDIRPVFRNRKALGYILAYSVHIWELFGFRTWLVAFLAFAAGLQGAELFGLRPTQLATILLLLHLPAAILGNEAALRFGRRRAITATMLLSAALACTLGFLAPVAPWLLVLVCAVYSFLVIADSAAITAGAVAAAEPARRGATMAVHTMLGFGAGVLGPLAFGAILDLSGGSAEVVAWGLAFAAMGLVAALGPVFLARFSKGAPGGGVQR